jgi:hypothetical protein
MRLVTGLGVMVEKLLCKGLLGKDVASTASHPRNSIAAPTRTIALQPIMAILNHNGVAGNPIHSMCAPKSYVLGSSMTGGVGPTAFDLTVD